MNAKLARIYERQAEHAGLAAIMTAIGGSIATLSFAIVAASRAGDASVLTFAGVVGLGSAVTAVLYAVTGALPARAQAAQVRHQAAAEQDEDQSVPERR